MNREMAWLLIGMIAGAVAVFALFQPVGCGVWELAQSSWWGYVLLGLVVLTTWLSGYMD